MVEIDKNDIMLNLGTNELKNMLVDVYTACIKYKQSFDDIGVQMLWGLSGVGKSMLVYELAHELEQNTGKLVDVIDIRLSYYNPVDLKGIPTKDEKNENTIWLLPREFRMDPSDKKIHILFLDELSSAPPSVQAAAYKIILDRFVGDYKLPDNCIIIAAGNRETDRAVAYTMSSALANRLNHVNVDVDPIGWLEWARENDIDERICAYIEYRFDRLYDTYDGESLKVFATPRTWKRTSDMLKKEHICDDYKKKWICTTLGVPITQDFFNFSNRNKKVINVRDIFEGRSTPMPEKDNVFSTLMSMGALAKEYKDDYEAIRRSIKYAIRLHPEDTVLYINELRSFGKSFLYTLEGIPEYIKWCQDNEFLED